MKAVLENSPGERIMDKVIILNQIIFALKKKIQTTDDKYFRVNSINWFEGGSEFVASVKVTENKKHPSDQYELFVKLENNELEFFNNNYVHIFKESVVA